MEKRKTIAAGAGLLLLGIVVVIGIIVFRRPDQDSAQSPAIPTSPDSLPGTQNIVPLAPTTADLNSLSNDIAKAQQGDQDLDGLSDTEEVSYHTSPTSSDTDNDGLFDRDEIQIYKTDPLKKDSDGDGKIDGYEVKHNTNPLGAGALILTPPTPTTSTTTR